MQTNEHEGYAFDGKAGFIAHLGKGDIIALGLTLYFANILALKLFSHPMMKGLVIVGALAGVYVVSQILKRVLAPYPRIVRHFFDWYVGGVDAVVPAPDADAVPLRGAQGSVKAAASSASPLERPATRIHAA